MKNLLLIAFISFFSGATVFAQDAFKDLKNAEKAIKKFVSDGNNGDELTKGIQLLESAFTSDEVMASSKSWITKGKILTQLAEFEMRSKTLDTEGTYVISAPNAASDAYDAFAKASTMAEKKNEKKEIQVGLGQLEQTLNNFAISAYQVKDYAGAYTNFSKTIEASNMLSQMGKETRLSDPALMSEQHFFAAVSAYYNKDFDNAKPHLDRLYTDGSKEAFVYDALYNVNAESNPDKALEFLAKGREMLPDDTSLLFTEINHYLKSGELNTLIGKLEMAIEKEPENVSVYNTLGSVYDQLQQQEEDPSKSAEYRESAESYYQQVLEMDPKNFDATYSIGALYYNKAASYVDVLNELSADFSPAGIKKYDAKKEEMDGLFKQALPFFEDAEGLNNKDLNTVIALKEIYARLNNLEKSNEYKAKYEKLAAER